jgi:ubiquinone/menaquinone biosynthesis C-methylase UbiE
MVLADIGAGTGYLAAGLAKRVRQVYLIDRSSEMLETARIRLSQADNLIFQQADIFYCQVCEHIFYFSAGRDLLS